MNDFISIITVNYNGERFLKNFLNSTRSIDYPRSLYEVIVVDNASSDNSVKLIRKNYPEVRIIESKINTGFGGGNNLGIRNAKGEFVLLLNSDTAMDKSAVKNLVQCVKSWKGKKVGTVSAKLVLIDRYIHLVLEDAFLHNFVLPVRAKGFNSEPFITRSTVRKFKEEIFLPVSYENNFPMQIKLILRNPGEKEYRVFLNNELIEQGEYPRKKNYVELALSFKKEQKEKYLVDLIQNAGNIIFRDGYGRDRGTLIIGGKQHYEEDKGQYDRPEPIQAFCGAGVLIRKRALDEVGYFDENFFMYYEDDDLSLRLKKRGWETTYCPKALVRHIHAASSREWSPLFIFNVERNRLLFVSKHWPRIIVILEWLKYLLKNTFGVPIYHLAYGEFRAALSILKLRLKVNLSLLTSIPANLLIGNRLSFADIREFY